MSQAQDAMVQAMIGCIGAHETNGDNVNFITSWYGEDGQPWCDMAVTYAAYHSGNIDAVCFGVKRDYTVDHAQAFADHGQWHTDVAGIQRGDIVFFDWSGSNSISAIDHVGVVESVSGSDVNTIEGNIDNVCKRMVRHSDFIVGYGRPAYAPDPTPIPPQPTGGTYKVASGDTLSSIARHLGVTLAALLAVNPQITDPDLIYPGQLINVPTSPGPTPPPQPTPTPTPTPTVVSLELVRAASSGGEAYPEGVAAVQNGLAKLGYLDSSARGIWTRSTTSVYAAFQRSLGYSGADASGHPGSTSLHELAKRSGLFTVSQ